jgi:hypothetical protein
MLIADLFRRAFQMNMDPAVSLEAALQGLVQRFACSSCQKYAADRGKQARR